MLRLSRTLSTVPIIRSGSYFSLDKLEEMRYEVTSNAKMEHLVKSGAEQAVTALNTIDDQLKEMDSTTVSASVTLNVGLLQITFTSGKSKTTID